MQNCICISIHCLMQKVYKPVHIEYTCVQFQYVSLYSFVVMVIVYLLIFLSLFGNVQMRRFGGSSSGGSRSGGSRSGGYRSGGYRSGGYRSGGSSSTSSSGPSPSIWYGSPSVQESSSSSYPKGKWEAVEKHTQVGAHWWSSNGNVYLVKTFAQRHNYVKNPSGQMQYFWWNRQNKTLGTHLTNDGGHKFGYKIAGYGTSWGTNFTGGAGKYNMKKGFSRKTFGLGVGSGFLGGSALEEAGVLAKYSVYHRYAMFRQMMHTRNPGLYTDWDDEYYTNYYQRFPFYCQPQTKSQLSWAELAILLMNPATSPIPAAGCWV